MSPAPCRLRVPAPRARQGAAARGYTVIEVLMAMTVLAIGGAGVITMQKTSVQGNLDARKADIANSIARMWVERLRLDSASWTTPTQTTATTNFGGTLYLNGNVGNGWFVPSTTLSPTDASPTMSAGFDILGRDLAAGDMANALFCVNLRLTWLTTSPATSANPGGDMIRADVRVLWPVGIAVAPPSAFCTTANTANYPDPNSPNAPNLTYHAVYLTTNVLENTSL